MMEPVSRIKDAKLFRAVLWAIVGDQPFRNSMLVEDSLEMIVLELMFVSFCMIGNLLNKSAISSYSVPFQWNRYVARVC